jgi:hypothetical protein
VYREVEQLRIRAEADRETLGQIQRDVKEVSNILSCIDREFTEERNRWRGLEVRIDRLEANRTAESIG